MDVEQRLVAFERPRPGDQAQRDSRQLHRAFPRRPREKDGSVLRRRHLERSAVPDHRARSEQRDCGPEVPPDDGLRLVLGPIFLARPAATASDVRFDVSRVLRKSSAPWPGWGRLSGIKEPPGVISVT